MGFDLEAILGKIPGGTRKTRMPPSEEAFAPSSTQEMRAGTSPATHPQEPANGDPPHTLRVRAVDMRALNPHAPRPVQDEENAPSEPPMRVLRVGGTLSTRGDPQASREELIAIYRQAWELVEALRKVDWELAGEYGRKLNRSPLEAAPAILEELRRIVREVRNAHTSNRAQA